MNNDHHCTTIIYLLILFCIHIDCTCKLSRILLLCIHVAPAILPKESFLLNKKNVESNLEK